MKSSWEPLGPVDGMEVSGLEASDTNDGNHLRNLQFPKWSTKIKIWPTVKLAMANIYL